MLGKDAVISSADPETGERVRVTVTGSAADWEPAAAVVFVGRRGCYGTAALDCCDALNFFAGPDSAHTWAGRHPAMRGEIIGRRRAQDLGEQVFGRLLSDG
ncbi:MULTISPECIES: organomercurial lyase [unclassified Streptomyces]|uniref:organomercurial lyase n=1 Tax=unclassified Streptomyces TaxID=2593676 RepID=UPI001BEA4E61|nr:MULTISPECIES: organomercurial lyase [unclassified Streptomyces]MBT2404776.1 hypothetical protein [Streptomyces sp. ISL-21]MBT2455005.1 hypothetical protein [Streptomyces sp. ISL-86]MBT2609071.1 hypothetical protein [Streptomyces sp. ISL-87]